jgi:hypothetical protein
MFRLRQRQSHDTLIDFCADFIRIDRSIELKRAPKFSGRDSRWCCQNERAQLLILS